MKKLQLLLAGLLILCVMVADAQRRPVRAGARMVKDTTIVVEDSIEYYEEEIIAKQKNYFDLLKGKWLITSMKRQARMEEEKLENVFLSFISDSTFSGKASCNNISGKIMLKGTGIKFSDIISTKMACAQLDTESSFLKLLQQTISAYTVNNDQLLLRDGSSNIVFTASRLKE